MFGKFYTTVINTFADFGFDHQKTTELADECNKFVEKLEDREQRKEAKQLLKKLMAATYLGVSKIVPEFLESGRLTFNEARETEIKQLNAKIKKQQDEIIRLKQDVEVTRAFYSSLADVKTEANIGLTNQLETANEEIQEQKTSIIYEEAKNKLLMEKIEHLERSEKQNKKTLTRELKENARLRRQISLYDEKLNQIEQNAKRQKTA